MAKTSRKEVEKKQAPAKRAKTIVITKGKTPLKRDGKGGKTVPDKFETIVEPNLDLISAWIRDGLSKKQIAENLGICTESLNKYCRQYPEFKEMFKKDRQKLDLVHMVNAYQRRAEGYTTIEIEKEYKILEDGSEQLVRIKEKERHVPGDARALENWINLRMSDDPLWGKLREIIHDRNIESAIEGGLVFIPEKKKIKDGDNLESTTETSGVHEQT